MLAICCDRVCLLWNSGTLEVCAGKYGMNCGGAVWCKWTERGEDRQWEFVLVKWGQ